MIADWLPQVVVHVVGAVTNEKSFQAQLDLTLSLRSINLVASEEGGNMKFFIGAGQ